MFTLKQPFIMFHQFCHFNLTSRRILFQQFPKCLRMCHSDLFQLLTKLSPLSFYYPLILFQPYPNPWLIMFPCPIHPLQCCLAFPIIPQLLLPVCLRWINFSSFVTFVFLSNQKVINMYSIFPFKLFQNTLNPKLTLAKVFPLKSISFSNLGGLDSLPPLQQ